MADVTDSIKILVNALEAGTYKPDPAETPKHKHVVKKARLRWVELAAVARVSWGTVLAFEREQGEAALFLPWTSLAQNHKDELITIAQDASLKVIEPSMLIRMSPMTRREPIDIDPPISACLPRPGGYTRFMNTTTETMAPSIDPALGAQFSWHRKPAGWAGAPCPVCGCEAKRLRAEHRALTADEAWKARYRYEKRVSACFGLDMAINPIQEEA